ncbi:hypothetical protein DID75_05125 [Candidatus Marinamargulisbacteria bacterium SCGC AG-410-N11]|nr:hypothetical protein DID75_05125 [Candidatus Marinamargulisbacteria bacterium SCGC AG-410-N11]
MSNYLPKLNQYCNITDTIAKNFYSNNKLTIELKKNNTLVTEADKEIELTLRKNITKDFPDAQIIGEEFNDKLSNSNLKFYIDPIDGTENFIRKIPTFATLISIEYNKVITAAMISNPITKERWYAEINQGAYHNQDKIKVSTINKLSNSLAFHGSLYGSECPNNEKILKILKHTKRQRGFGDFLSHTLVAQGSGELSIDFNLKPWDQAPLGIIITEAGGKITDWEGNKFTPHSQSVIATNKLLHKESLQILNTN